MGCVDQPVTISLLGRWGSGKTVFLERFVAHMDAQHQLKCIVIDAWKSDHHGDPLTPILAQLVDAIESAQDLGGVGARASALITRLADLGANYILPATAIAADIVTPGAGTTAAATGKLAKTAIAAQRERNRREPDFRVALEQARDTIARRKPNGPVRPIVFVIDELDRCRPSYAIQLLERIKHYFDIKGLVFVIATDHGNLPSAVKTVYGAHVDGEEYLRKFFDYQFHLKGASRAALAGHLVQREFGVASVQELPNEIWEKMYRREQLLPAELIMLNYSEYVYHFTTISDLFGLSARDQVQAFTIIGAFLRARRHATTLPLIDCFVACSRFGCNSAFMSLVEHGTIKIGENKELQSKNIELGWRKNLLEMFFTRTTPADRNTPEPYWDLFYTPARRRMRSLINWRIDYECRTGLSMAARFQLLNDLQLPQPYVAQLIRLSELITPSEAEDQRHQ